MGKGEPALGRLPPARLGALCSAALLGNDGLVDVLRREQRLDVVVVVAVVVIVVLCVVGALRTKRGKLELK